MAPTALWTTQSMLQKRLWDYYSDDSKCPTCGEVKASNRGMRQHHAIVHGWSLTDELRICEKCGDEFEVKAHSANANKYCSHKCAGASVQESGEDHRNYKERIEVECDHCGETYEVRPSRADRTRFCSKSCAGKDRFPTGTDNPAWNGGLSLYHRVRTLLGDDAWHTRRKDAKEHLPDECELCGKHQANLERELDVHHIVPVKAGGCNADELLMHLCRVCHKKVELYTWDIPEVEPMFTPHDTS